MIYLIHNILHKLTFYGDLVQVLIQYPSALLKQALIQQAKKNHKIALSEEGY